MEVSASPATANCSHSNNLKPAFRLLQESTPEFESALRTHIPLSLVAAVTVYEQLHLNDEEAFALLPGLLAELVRRLPECVADVALMAALPHLAERFRCRYARSSRVTAADAEDLSHNAVVKILNAVRGSHPRGNIGAWVATVRDNVLRDYWRRLERRNRK